MNDLQQAYDELPDASHASDQEDEFLDLDADTMTLAGEFADIMLRIRDTKTETEMLEKRAKAIEPKLMERMNVEGCQNLNVRGLTIFRKTNRYVSKAKGVETDDLVAALKDCGMGWLVKDAYNAMQLKSAVLEKIEAGEELPQQVKGLLSIGENYTLGTRK